MGLGNDITYIDMATSLEQPAEGNCSCGHSATMQFEWAPGHLGGLICDCCIRKVWEETLENVTKALAEQVVACPKEA